MSYKTPLALSAIVAAAFIAANTVEFDRSIEGQVALTSDQFTQAGVIQKIIDEQWMREDISPDPQYYLASNKHGFDFDKSVTTRLIPVDTGKGFYRVKLTIPFGEAQPVIREGDYLRATVSGTLLEHIKNHKEAQETKYPLSTPEVAAETFEVSESL